MHAEQAYVFRHALLRDAAYVLQPPSERSRLHAHAGEILAREPEAATLLAAEIADHAREAHDHARELHYLVLAADHAARVYELDLEAALCLRAAASPACGDRQAAELTYRAAGALMARGRMAQAEPQLDSAVSLALGCGDRVLELSAQLRRCELWIRTARRARAMEAIPALIERARGLNDNSLMVAAELALDDLHEHRGEYAQCAEALRRALDFARAAGDGSMQAKVMSSLSYRLHRNGQTAEGEALARAGLALNTDDPVARATLLNSVGVICVETSRLDEAEAAYEESARICVASGRILTEAGLLANLANLEYYFRGDLEKAARRYARARDLYREAGDLENAARCARMAGSTDYAAGRRAAAAGHFEAAIELSRAAGIADNHLESLRFLELSREDSVAGYDALPGLLDVARRSIQSGLVRNSALGLCDIARRLIAAGLPLAAARALALAETIAAKNNEISSAGPRRLIGQVLGLEDVPEPQREQLRQNMPASDTPHHHVNLTLWPDLSRALLALHGTDGAEHLRGLRQHVREQCSALLAEIRQLATGRARAYHVVKLSLREAEDAVAESEAAIAAGRPALLFRGALVGRMTLKCRAALGAQLRAQRPEAFEALAQANPTLAAQLSGPAPNWDDADLPGEPLQQMESLVAGAGPMQATN
jgi:tetratricopeptide (TPR) repeat protein